MVNIQVEPNDFKFVDTFKHEVYEFDGWDEFVSWLKKVKSNPNTIFTVLSFHLKNLEKYDLDLTQINVVMKRLDELFPFSKIGIYQSRLNFIQNQPIIPGYSNDKLYLHLLSTNSQRFIQLRSVKS